MNRDLIWSVVFFALGTAMAVIGSDEASNGDTGSAFAAFAMAVVDFALAYVNFRDFCNKRQDGIEG